MTTVIKSAIRSASGWAGMTSGEQAVYDYNFTLLSSWEASTTACPTDLVTADVQCVAELYNDWSTGLPDSTQFAARTTDATRNVIVQVLESQRHDGTHGTGFFFASTADFAENIEVTGNCDAKFIGLDSQYDHTGRPYQCLIADSSKQVIFDKCITKLNNDSKIQGGFSIDEASVINCAVFGSSDNAGYTGINITNYSHGSFLNNTLVNCHPAGINCSYDNYTTIKNNVCYGNTGDFNLAGNGTFTYNASGDTTATTLDPTNSISGITSLDFFDAENDDYHLSASSNLIGAGTNLYTEFTTDIDGDTWPSSGAWDIGFDHYVGAGGSVTIEAAITYALSGSVSTVASVIAQSTINNAVNLDSSNIGNATTEAATTQSVTLNSNFSYLISIEASVSETVNTSVNNTANANAEAFSENHITTVFSVSQEAVAQASASMSAGAGFSTSATVDAGGAVNADIQFNLSINSAKTADAVSEANLSIGSQLGLTASADVVANASIASGVDLASIITSGIVIESGVAFASNARMSAVAQALSGAYILADIVSNITVGSTGSANASAEANVQASANIACAIIAEAAAEAGLTIGQISGVVVNGTVLSGIVEIPDGRKYIVSAEVKITTVGAENRTYIVPTRTH